MALTITALALFAPAGAEAGVDRAARSSADCASQALSRPFLPWLDPTQYTMPDGGSFEDGAEGWSLRGSAEIVSGNEPFRVRNASDSRSLLLPPGSSAVSSPVCIGLGHPTMRFFAKKGAGLLGKKRLLLSTLRVDVRYEDASGATRSLPVGVVTAAGGWQPTLPIPVIVNLLTLLPNAQTDVSFAFTPTGSANWRIDDVYVDPMRRS